VGVFGGFRTKAKLLPPPRLVGADQTGEWAKKKLGQCLLLSLFFGLAGGATRPQATAVARE